MLQSSGPAPMGWPQPRRRKTRAVGCGDGRAHVLLAALHAGGNAPALSERGLRHRGPGQQFWLGGIRSRARRASALAPPDRPVHRLRPLGTAAASRLWSTHGPSCASTTIADDFASRSPTTRRSRRHRSWSPRGSLLSPRDLRSSISCRQNSRATPQTARISRSSRAERRRRWCRSERSRVRGPSSRGRVRDRGACPCTRRVFPPPSTLAPPTRTVDASDVCACGSRAGGAEQACCASRLVPSTSARAAGSVCRSLPSPGWRGLVDSAPA